MKTKRPRLRNARHKYEKFNLTEYIAQLHAASTAMRIIPPTTGAFGGCTERERTRRRVIKQANPVGSPVA